jgi:hypothetical protein
MRAVHGANRHRQQPVDGLPQHDLLRPPKDLLGASVKAHNAKRAIQRDDRIGGNINDGRERGV